MTFEREVETALRLAEKAGAVALDFQTRGIAAEEKPDESPVTAADRACEQLIVDGLLAAFPGDGLLGEEGSNSNGASGRRWIIDPIDGTKDFLRGIPVWSILIGLEENGEVVAGVAHCPGQRATAWAARGGGAWMGTERLKVSNASDPSRAVLCFNGLHKAGVGDMAPRLLGWASKFWAVRGLGGSMDAMLVAQGRADVWIEPNAAPWDLAPLKILVEEAGGKFASFAGEASIYGGNAYACAPALEQFVKTLFG
jgi:histidinol phosphatase-like enzyme (inositol monophosphatase family)